LHELHVIEGAENVLAISPTSQEHQTVTEHHEDEVDELEEVLHGDFDRENTDSEDSAKDEDSQVDNTDNTHDVFTHSKLTESQNDSEESDGDGDITIQEQHVTSLELRGCRSAFFGTTQDAGEGTTTEESGDDSAQASDGETQNTRLVDFDETPDGYTKDGSAKDDLQGKHAPEELEFTDVQQQLDGQGRILAHGSHDSSFSARANTRIVLLEVFITDDNIRRGVRWHPFRLRRVRCICLIRRRHIFRRSMLG